MMWTIKVTKFIKLWEAIKRFKCDDFRHTFEGMAFRQGLGSIHLMSLHGLYNLI